MGRDETTKYTRMRKNLPCHSSAEEAERFRNTDPTKNGALNLQNPPKPIAEEFFDRIRDD
jgi:hypothetical protein